MPRPCTHFRPASITDHFELSIMIGTRAISGSVAMRFRNVVIAFSESSRSASMFTSITLAPLRTCSSATSTPLWKSPDSIRRRNLAEPVMFVRSPTITKPVSGRDPERLEAAERRVPVVERSGPRAGRRRWTVSAIIRMCSGVVPQHPPTMFTSPARANSPSRPLVVSGVSS